MDLFRRLAWTGWMDGCLDRRDVVFLIDWYRDRTGFSGSA